MPPFFTTIVATWNRAGLLPRALDSVLAQTDPDWEVIVVDDGSSDGTADVMAPYLRDRRFLFETRPHEGPWRARNHAARLARGRWLTFLDSDDAWSPAHLERRRAFLAAHPDCRLVHGGVLVIGPPELQHVPDARDPSKLIRLDECAVGGTFVIDPALFERLGGFEDTYGADHTLLRKAGAVGPVGICPDRTYLYYRQPGEGVCEALRAEHRAPDQPGDQPGAESGSG